MRHSHLYNEINGTVFILSTVGSCVNIFAGICFHFDLQLIQKSIVRPGMELIIFPHDEICDWYDGYQFGRTEIFNPWSVINYFGNEYQPKAFWQSTGSNDVINEVLTLSDVEITVNLRNLLHGDTIKTKIDTSVLYLQIHNNPASIYSFLLMAGYLKPVGERMLIGSSDFYAVAIPNKEIQTVFKYGVAFSGKAVEVVSA